MRANQLCFADCKRDDLPRRSARQWDSARPVTKQPTWSPTIFASAFNHFCEASQMMKTLQLATGTGKFQRFRLQLGLALVRVISGGESASHETTTDVPELEDRLTVSDLKRIKHRAAAGEVLEAIGIRQRDKCEASANIVFVKADGRSPSSQVSIRVGESVLGRSSNAVCISRHSAQGLSAVRGCAGRSR